MVFSLLGVGLARPWLLSSLSVMVEVEADEEREKVFARGPRWVSFSSAGRILSARVMPMERDNTRGGGTGSRCRMECRAAWREGKTRCCPGADRAGSGTWSEEGRGGREASILLVSFQDIFIFIRLEISGRSG